MRVKLEDVCEKGSSNLKQSEVINRAGDYPIYVAAGYLGNVNFYHQENPYISVVKDGAGIGRTGLYPAKSSVIGTMQYILPKENVIAEYLYYVVKYMHLEKYFTGATIPYIYFKDYKNETFNLETLERQAEITKILKKVENIIEIRKAQLKCLDDLVSARFVEMFGDPVRNQHGYEKVYLSELADIKIGPFGSLLHKEDYIEGGHALLNPSHIIDGKVAPDNKLSISDEKYNELLAYQLHVGDVVMGRRGEMGRCAVISEEGYSMWHWKSND